MTDYTELVKALRCCATCDCDSEKCKYIGLGMGEEVSCIMAITKDAAAAIEALQAQLSKRGEIVRCGECKYWMDIDDGRQKHEMCAQLMPNWFCADGEREVQE